MNKNVSLLIVISLLLSFSTIAQKQKQGDFTVASSNVVIVNEFAVLTADANAGDLLLTLDQTTLNVNNRFPNVLEKGDLLLIHQAQGVSVNASPEPWTGNGIYGLPLSSQWGEITNYNNCGNYEYIEVDSVLSDTVVRLRCALENNYTASGKVQVVRVPRYRTLTVNGTITTQAWDGSTGGILAIEVDSTLFLNGLLSADSLGFRGGISALVNSINGSGDYASIDATHGGMKGEGVAGYDADYIPFGGQYGKGAPANGGGGSCAHNGGGGGGANAGDTSLWNNGVGVPNPSYNLAWSLETPSISGVVASGGGRGGYTFSANDEDANVVPPGNSAWGSDDRRNQGGFGGRPLEYSTGKIFFGGGGGSGDRNNNYNTGANGGRAGGIILIQSYGNIEGNGTISANGQNGQNLETDSPPLFSYGGNDGAGGGGAGGTVIVKHTGITPLGSITIKAQGGNGGNQVLERGFGYVLNIDEAEGPGGGGGGGYVATTLPWSAPVLVNGGSNGTTNSDALDEFPPNGATSGGVGIHQTIGNNINLLTSNDTLCLGDSTVLTAQPTDTLPTGYTIFWYDENMNVISSGTSFSTGAITSDTSFLVGVCPLANLERVFIKIGASFIIDTSAVIVADEHCGQGDGSITGIVISGGGQPWLYEWNGQNSNNTDTLQLSSGNYTFTVSDSAGCATQSVMFTVNNTSAPAIDTLQMQITPETCENGNGSITGISVSGGTGTLNYSWNNSTTTLNNSNLTGGFYTLQVTDNFGCQDSITVEVGALESPNADFITNGSGYYFVDDTVFIQNTSSNDVTIWNYNFGNGEISNNENTFVIYDEVGIFIICLEVENAWGCKDTVCKNVYIEEQITETPIVVPNVFTPNSDGENDTFVIQGIKENDALIIYNRWGVKIYEATPYKNDWKGKGSKGQELSEGTYYYLLIRENKAIATGHLSLYK